MSHSNIARGSAPTRRGASIVPIAIGILVVGGLIYGGLYWYSHKADKAPPAKTSDASVAVSGFLGDLEASLANIEKEPAKADEEIENITKLAGEDIADLTKQIGTATPDIKAKIVALVAEYLPKLQPLIDKAYAVPGVKEKLEPIVGKLMTAIKALGT